MSLVKGIILVVLGITLHWSFCLGRENLTNNNEVFIVNLIWKCSNSEDFGVCLKLRAAKFLNELLRKKEPLPINEYLSLARNSRALDNDQTDFDTPEAEIEKSSAETMEEKSEKLDKIIWNKLSSLFTSRTIQLSLPSDVFQGRDKEGKILKKGGGLFLMTAMMGGMMMKMAMAKIALIAGKALILAKIALVLTLLISLRRLIGQGGGGGGGAEIVYAASDHAGGRSFPKNLDISPIWKEGGSDLAYNAHRSKD